MKRRNVDWNTDSHDTRNDNCIHEDCNDHDNNEVQNQHHMKNTEQLVDWTMKPWLILDNADNNLAIDIIILGWNNKDPDMVDTTSNMDMITKLFKDLVLNDSNELYCVSRF